MNITPPARIHQWLRLVVILCGLAAAHAGPAFWVWNRNTALSETEKRDLDALGVNTLYWQYAEITNHNGVWKWKRLPESLPETSNTSLRIVPVIRLESSKENPFDPSNTNKLAELLVTAFQSTHADEWQLDYDATDRLVGDYAAFLSELRKSAPKLSATALAGWVRLPAFDKLCRSVAELCPMFYDLQPDTAISLRQLLDPDETITLIDEWRKKSSVPWKTGLPWFSRLTVYGEDGKSRGHFRQWSWDDLMFRRELKCLTPLKHGMRVFRAEKSFAIGRFTVRKGETLVARWPDAAALACIQKHAANDLIFFRLPDAAASSGGSLSELTRSTESATTVLTLTREGDRLVLTNAGPGDLRPRAIGDGPNDRGYAVEVDATGPVFREAEAGAFFRVAAHKNPDAEIPEQVTIPSATRLTWWFSALPVGSSIASGVFQTAPATGDSTLRYRILNFNDNSSWKSLESSH